MYAHICTWCVEGESRDFFGSPTHLCPVLHVTKDFLNDFGQTASLYLSLSVKPKAYEDSEDALVIEGFL